MTCKEKILSEDYIDLINYFILPQGESREMTMFSVIFP